MIKVNLAPDMDRIAKKNGMSRDELENFLALVRRGMAGRLQNVNVAENGVVRYYNIEMKGVGPLKTPLGIFWQYNFIVNDHWRNYNVIVRAEKIDEESLNPVFKDKDRLIVRVDSGCVTGQLFEDSTCDCKAQLDFAMKTISESEGIVIHIPRQDGRGMGLHFKLSTLWLQKELGINTIESASLLAPGGVIDVRTYSGVIGILKFFEIPSDCQINLITNNPQKTSIFEENEYAVKCLPVNIPPTEETRDHLLAKKEHLGHTLEIK